MAISVRQANDAASLMQATRSHWLRDLQNPDRARGQIETATTEEVIERIAEAVG
jgi:hypothetical protein